MINPTRAFRLVVLSPAVYACRDESGDGDGVSRVSCNAIHSPRSSSRSRPLPLPSPFTEDRLSDACGCLRMLAKCRGIRPAILKRSSSSDIHERVTHVPV